MVASNKPKATKSMQEPRITSVSVDGQRYSVPPTEATHATLVKTAIREEEDLCFVTPTLRQEYLDRHVLEGLFEMMGTKDRRAIMVMSRNSSVRDRYEQMEGAFQFSTGRWPLASVDTDGSLIPKTKHYVTEDAPPAVIYAKWATRLPAPEHAETIQCVLYDESVGFDEDRWESFQEWREEAGIPTVVYYVRNPLGETYERVKGKVESTWTWPTNALRNVVDDPKYSLNSDELYPESCARDTALLKQKAAGQRYEPHVCSRGPVVEQFNKVWDAHKEYERVVKRIGKKRLGLSRYYLRNTIAGFSRLCADLSISDTYRAGQYTTTPLSGRISGLKKIKGNLSGEAAAAGSTLEQAIFELEELAERLKTEDVHTWKRGAVLNAMLQAVDDEETMIIVGPDGPGADAIIADLHRNRRDFYEKAKEYVTICPPEDLAQQGSVDYLLLYGPPKYQDRWLLRAPNGATIAILTYPHELGLLHSQAAQLNEVLANSTPVTFDGESEERPDIQLTGGPVIKEASSWLSPIVEGSDSVSNSNREDSKENGEPENERPPTIADPRLDGVQIEIPDAEAIESGEVSGSDAFEANEKKSETTRKKVDDFIEKNLARFDSTEGGYVPSEEQSTREREQVEWQRRDVDGCVELISEDGYRMADLPEETISVVRLDAKTRQEKPISSVKPGEVVVAVRDTMEIREHVERELLEMGRLGIVVKANKWKEHLRREIDARDDDFEQFVERINSTNIDPKNEGTYRRWYHGEVTIPKAKDSLYYIAEAYGLEEVQEELEEIWRANYVIRNVKKKLIDAWLDQAHEALIAEEETDVILNEDLDIRASDFQKVDEEGEPLVQAHVIDEIRTNVTVPHSYLGTWRK